MKSINSMFSNGLKFEHSQTKQNGPSSNATGKFSFLNHQRQLSFQSPAVVKKSTSRKQNENIEKGDGNAENTNFDENDDVNDNINAHAQSDQFDDIDNLSDINFTQNESAFIQELRDELSHNSSRFSKQLADQKAHYEHQIKQLMDRVSTLATQVAGGDSQNIAYSAEKRKKMTFVNTGATGHTHSTSCQNIQLSKTEMKTDLPGDNPH